jgi:hypothetical protein
MNSPKIPLRLYSAILLIGICSCDPEQGPGPVEEQVDVDAIDVIDVDEIDSNDPETAQASVDPLEADFNGDGNADLVIGVPFEQVDGEQAGAINVLYGTDDGLDDDDDELFDRDTSGVPGLPDEGDEFGHVLAAGDFNNDGNADLAIGAPSDEVDGVDGAGSVTILYGSDDGLDTDDSQFWSQGSSGIEDDLDVDDNFGYALITGDFDGDNYDDLAIGVPGEDVSGEDDAGLIHVIYGSADGLAADRDQIWHQGTDGVTGRLEDGDGFGASLAAGDFDADGPDDLAIGVPGEDLDNTEDAGWVHVLYGTTDGGSVARSTPGSSRGLSSDDEQVWHQDIDGIEGDAESHDEFGFALTVGDFDHDGKDDLAAGVPGEDINSRNAAGAVNTIYGSSSGLTRDGDQFWHLDKAGIEDESDEDDRFGEALAAGDFDEDGRDDLAIGAPGGDVQGDESAGQVHVLYGKDSGLSSDDDQRWTQNTQGIEGIAEAHDRFGQALTTGDYDGDGTADLSIGVPFEDIGSIDDAGAVNVIYGDDSDGLDDEDNQFWHQDRSGIDGDAESDDSFGIALR